MRIAAITTRDNASLFLDSVVCSSDCVATCDNADRFGCDSGAPFLLKGRVSEDILGDRESGRDSGRDRAFAEGGRDKACAEGGRDSECDVCFVSMERDLRCESARWLS